VIETTDEEVTERDIEIGETIATVVSDEDPDHRIIEHPGATTRATHIPQAEIIEQENEKTDMVDEAEQNEMNVNGTEIGVLVGEMMESDRLDATATYLMIEEVVDETEETEGIEQIEVDAMAGARIATSLQRKLGAARRAHLHHRSTESPRQILQMLSR
jgi:hypothetical protein